MARKLDGHQVSQLVDGKAEMSCKIKLPGEQISDINLKLKWKTQRRNKEWWERGKVKFRKVARTIIDWQIKKTHDRGTEGKIERMKNEEWERQGGREGGREGGKKHRVRGRKRLKERDRGSEKRKKRVIGNK